MKSRTGFQENQEKINTQGLPAFWVAGSSLKIWQFAAVLKKQQLKVVFQALQQDVHKFSLFKSGKWTITCKHQRTLKSRRQVRGNEAPADCPDGERHRREVRREARLRLHHAGQRRREGTCWRVPPISAVQTCRARSWLYGLKILRDSEKIN